MSRAVYEPGSIPLTEAERLDAKAERALYEALAESGVVFDPVGGF